MAETSTAFTAAVSKATGEMAAGSPITIDGDHVITAAGVRTSNSQQPLIIACKLSANGKLPGHSALTQEPGRNQERQDANPVQPLVKMVISPAADAAPDAASMPAAPATPTAAPP